jgi:hypothetical protein
VILFPCSSFAKAERMRFTISCTLLLVLAVPLAAFGQLDYELKPTNVWMNFYGTEVLEDGFVADNGTIVWAFDPDGVKCGEAETFGEGKYGFMAVYADDGETPDIDEGAETGDTLYFFVAGIPSNTVAEWTSSGDRILLNLSVEHAVTSGFSVQSPAGVEAAPGDTLTYVFSITNTGSHLDYLADYVLSSSQGSSIIEPDFSGFLLPGQTRDVPLKLVIPADADADDTLSGIFIGKNLSSNSTIDPVVTRITPLDADGDEPLPGRFALYQNYPNPYNPSTTISFSLDKAAEAVVSIFNISGQLVERRELGVLPAGDHSFVYEPKRLASGVYYYRLTAGGKTEERAMVLLK